MVRRRKEIPPGSFIALVDKFLDFLTVCFHTILYERGLYPKNSFISAKKYNYPVRQSRHPEVCEWINDVIIALEPELLEGKVDKVSLVIFSQDNTPMERFVFDMSSFPTVNKADWYVPIAPSQELGNQVPQVNMEEQFRAAISRIVFCHRDLEHLPDDCTFNIAVELKDEATPSLSHSSPWVPCETSLQHRVETENAPRHRGADLGGAQTTALRKVDAGPMVFELWVEEAQAKIRNLLPDETTSDNHKKLDNPIVHQDIPNEKNARNTNLGSTDNRDPSPFAQSDFDDFEDDFFASVDDFSDHEFSHQCT